MKERTKRASPSLPLSRVGKEAATEYTAFYAAFRGTNQERASRLRWRAPDEVLELEGIFRPGFIAFARDGAGDQLAWDVRKGTPKSGELPMIRWIDHEVGLAEPYARDLSGTLCHLSLQEVIGMTGHEASKQLAQVLATFEPFIKASDRAAMTSVLRKLDRAGSRIPLEGWKAGERAARPFTPQAETVWGGLPPTHLPLLNPTDAAELRDTAERYEDAAAEYRRMVHDEGRKGYGWYLASALLGLADVEMRRRRLGRAAKAAEEAIVHYGALYAAGELRCETQLAFCHRTLSLDAAKRRDPKSALAHAEQALDLLDSAVQSAASMVHALGQVAQAWEHQRAGDAGDQVRPLLATACKQTRGLITREPPHPYREHAARIARLASVDAVTGSPEGPGGSPRRARRRR